MTAETPVLEPDEVEALLSQINTRTPTGARNYALLRLMADCGLRLGEALQVQSGDIKREDWRDENGSTVRVWTLRVRKATTKGKRPRQGLPLSSAVRQALERWQEKRAALGIRGGPLFCTVSRGKRRAGFVKTDRQAELVPGTQLSHRYVQQLVARLSRKAGIGHVHPHMLRHTALTALYDTTRDIRMVQEVAGHASVQTTQRYTHVHPIRIARAMGAVENGQ